mmetsp:Transcript_5538/g.4933  ORF Transcript_5538/g.4933 Transcript_5538/m.4933 type:complete len:107 (-) Transcript_5538:44-364(-)
MLSGGKDEMAVLYNIIDNSVAMTYSGHNSWVNSVVMSSCNLFVITGSSDRTVKIWNTLDGKLIVTKIGHDTGIKAVSLFKKPIYKELLEIKNDKDKIEIEPKMRIK